MEKALWLNERVKSGLRSFLVLLTFWPNYSLLWGCLMHWKTFSSTPGLYPQEANSRRQLTYSKYTNQWLLVKMKNVSFILWKRLNRLFGQHGISKIRKQSGGGNLQCLHITTIFESPNSLVGQKSSFQP